MSGAGTWAASLSGASADIFVVDSSVAVKWFKPDAEGGVPEALALLEAHHNEKVMLAAPTHLRLEVLNALWSHRLDAARLRQAAADLEDFGLAWFEPDAALLDSSAEIAAAHALTIYDALYIALALRLDAPLLTADRTLATCPACSIRRLG